jgi:hypothetical protein
VGPDGNLWFTGTLAPPGETTGATIAVGQTTLSGADTVFAIAPITDGIPPHGMTDVSAPVVGPDKNLYFTFSMSNLVINGNESAIVGITPSGGVFEAPTVLSSAGLDNETAATTVTTGPDGNLWFPVGASIGQLDLGQVQFSTPISLAS